jgi:nucleoside-diphosphate-sugar epimerase
MQLISSEFELEDRLSEPTDQAIESLRQFPGDILLLGVAGKMGPILARMAKRASDASGGSRRVMGVARFTDPRAEAELHQHGIETLRGDLLDESFVARLPEAPLVIYLAGMKFGATGNESATWAMNCHLPSLICRRFPASRIVAFSTGNVYGLVPVGSGGSREEDAPNPVGEYAMSCLGRERMFEHFSRAQHTPVALIRLNYACDLRYGVLVDLAWQIWRGEPINLAMGYFNTIWQRDANAMTLCALCHAASPPWIVNVTGPERLSVRETCERLAAKLERPVSFVGWEAEAALLSNAARCIETFGPSSVNATELIDLVAAWIKSGGRQLGKPTHFESRDGRF